jgi:acyl-CoA synthetase (AMP-forming)/AMP-acid ligase II
MIFGIDQAEKSNRTALIDAASGMSMRYEELAAGIEARANTLSKQRLFFLFCRNDLATVEWYCAALSTGAPVALLDANLAPELVQPLLVAYQPDLVFHPSLAPEGPYRKGSVEGLWESETESPLTHPDLALLLSTSGSTGNPKFVRLTRRNVTANAESINAALAIQPDERAIASLPLHYSYGLSVLNTHLLAGACLVLTVSGLTDPMFWRAVREHRCTSLAGVPYSYQILQRLGLHKMDVPTISTLTQAGGKLDDKLVMAFWERMKERSGRFFVMYGQTEATARIAVMPDGALPEKIGSAGVPIAGGRVQIVGPDSMLCEPGCQGELLYQGPNVMLGYALSRQDLTRGDECRGVLQTGDKARLDRDGYVFILGRMRREAKVFGLRLNLDDIEAQVRSYGPAAAIAAGQTIRIFCEFDDGIYSHLRQELATRLRIHQQAFEFVQVPALPLKANGKIDYQQLGQQ